MIRRISASLCKHTCPLSSLPKRPPTSYAYALYFSENLERLRTENPDHKDLLRKAGESWNLLPESERSVYVKKHDARKATYERFFAKTPLDIVFQVEEKKEKRYLLKKLVENGRLPKKPPTSGYHLFISRQKYNPKSRPNFSMI